MIRDIKYIEISPISTSSPFWHLYPFESRLPFWYPLLFLIPFTPVTLLSSMSTSSSIWPLTNCGLVPFIVLLIFISSTVPVGFADFTYALVDCITLVWLGLPFWQTSESLPFTISTNWRHLSANNRFGSRSRRPGYNRLVTSIASPMRPDCISFITPVD